ncbi:hypothetical protein Tco_0974254 [Tanacetum coccineum]|uniref:Uncharacterized protein n=1 Tax=Tanacetum coccineum TaxID=301880 RepID=A0ABQ5EB47_9ASTR
MKEMDSTEPQSTNVSTTPSPEVVHPVSTTPSPEVVHPDPVTTTPPSGVMKSLVLACGFALGGVGVLASSSAADVMQIGRAEVQKAAKVGAAIEAMLASGELVAYGGGAVLSGIVCVAFAKGCYKCFNSGVMVAVIFLYLICEFGFGYEVLGFDHQQPWWEEGERIGGGWEVEFKRILLVVQQF